MKAHPRLWPTVIMVSVAVVAILVFLDVAWPLRPVLLLWFLCVCPGMALVRLLGLREALSEWMFAVALSLSLDTLVATAMVAGRRWDPNLGLGLLLLISAAGAFLQLVRSYGWRASL